MSPTILKAENIQITNVTALLYSRPGMGKTTILGTLPGKTLILDVDKGTLVLRGNKNVDVIRMSESLVELKEALVWLQSMKELPYQNICIDTLTELESGMLTVYGRNGKNDGAPERGHYNQTQFKIMDYCRQFRSLNANIIFTAWELQKEIVEKTGESYTQCSPSLSGKCADSIGGLCEMIGRITVSPKDNERYIDFRGTAERIAKDRLWKRAFCKYDELLTPPSETKTQSKPKGRSPKIRDEQDDLNESDYDGKRTSGYVEDVMLSCDREEQDSKNYCTPN